MLFITKNFFIIKNKNKSVIKKKFKIVLDIKKKF